MNLASRLPDLPFKTAYLCTTDSPFSTFLSDLRGELSFRLYSETGLIVKIEFLHSLKSLIHEFSLKYPFKEFTAEGAEKRRGKILKKHELSLKQMSN